MSINKTSGIGLVIDLEDFIVQRPSVQAPDFWHLQNQVPLRKWLHPFLPQMVRNPDTNQVTASIVEDNKELLADSRDIQEADLPKAELARLESLLADLRNRIDREEVTPDVRHLIENFTLPNPATSPELYRVYGSPRHPRLAIIWGMCKKRDTPIAIREFRVREAFSVSLAGPGRRGCLWLLLLLIAVCVAYFICR